MTARIVVTNRRRELQRNLQQAPHVVAAYDQGHSFSLCLPHVAAQMCGLPAPTPKERRRCAQCRRNGMLSTERRAAKKLAELLKTLQRDAEVLRVAKRVEGVVVTAADEEMIRRVDALQHNFGHL